MPVSLFCEAWPASLGQHAAPPVPVTFHILGALREFTAGRSKVEMEQSRGTLADALAALWTLHTGVRDPIATEQGQVREHINIFIGDENVRYTGGLASPVPAGSEISIVPAVGGGWDSSSRRRRRRRAYLRALKRDFFRKLLWHE